MKQFFSLSNFSMYIICLILFGSSFISIDLFAQDPVIIIKSDKTLDIPDENVFMKTGDYFETKYSLNINENIKHVFLNAKMDTWESEYIEIPECTQAKLGQSFYLHTSYGAGGEIRNSNETDFLQGSTDYICICDKDMLSYYELTYMWIFISIN